MNKEKKDIVSGNKFLQHKQKANKANNLAV